MHIIRPLQLSFNQRVLEQNRRFYFTASATLGINLITGGELLDLYYLKDVFESMGDNPIPDTGMPKPGGEFLVSGTFYPPGKHSVQAGEAAVRLGEKEKTLYIFGPRKWKAAVPTAAGKITSMPLDYKNAFGGPGYDNNPEGIGFNDGLLPCIEDPANPVGSKADRPDPAGFGPLDFMLPQRMKYQGTYGQDYKRKYFPGYPEDHDWRYFLCAPEDQWIKDFFRGDESYALYNLHPENPVIKGSLPGLYARCFVNREKQGGQQFGEIPLNLDTVWFFPDKTLLLLIFRGVLEVEDDEAQSITHVLAAYEDMSLMPRSVDYYREAFEKRKNSDDDLLTNLNTHDLIPDGHASAMELLTGEALAGGEESEFEKNMQARAEAVRKTADEKIEQAVEQAEKNMQTTGLPAEDSPDIRKMMEQASDKGADPDMDELNNRLEAIMPGITAGDPGSMDLKNFSFDKLDELFEAVEEFSCKKQKDAEETIKTGIDKTSEQIKAQIKSIDQQLEQAAAGAGPENRLRTEALEESRKELNQNLEVLESFVHDKSVISPMPRINAEEIKIQTDQINPRAMEAMQHVESMKAAGVYDEATADLENHIREMARKSSEEIENAITEAEERFMEAYIMGAHFMDECASPHKEPIEDVRRNFLDAFFAGKQLAGGDWACIDLSGQNLDGIDLSNAYLEQVSFRGASLRGATFKRAVLARADLEDADFTGADMQEANIGAVSAHSARFTGANLNFARLSRGDFTNADFSGASLEDIELMEIVIDEACFHQAYMPRNFFLETNISGADFSKADLSECAFIQCSIEKTGFMEALMQRCAFADTSLRSVCFDRADLSNVCLVVTGPEKACTENLTFRAALLKQANFQNMDMKKAVFSNANLENAFFGGTDLTGADLCRANAKSAWLAKANLTGARLDEINLTAGSLAKAVLTRASFKRANLYQVDFLRSVITDTDFEASNLDATLIEHWRPR